MSKFNDNLLLERFNYLDILEINEYNKEQDQVSKRMITKLNDIDGQLLFLNESVIFCIPDDVKYKNIIKFNLNGTVSICLDTDLNLTSYKLSNNIVDIDNLYPKVKISVPRGVNLDFKINNNINYVNNLYALYDTNEIKNTTLVTDESILNNIIYSNLKFNLMVNINKLKNINKTLVIKKDESFVDLIFTPMYILGSQWSYNPNVNTVFIVNTEIYNTFETLFE